MKTFLSALCFFIAAFFVSSIAMSVVTDIRQRLPLLEIRDMGHRTLPSIMVGNYTALTLCVAFWIILCLIILRKNEHWYSIYVRILINYGLLLIMRSFSILVTIQPSPYGLLEPSTSKEWYSIFDYRNIFTSVGDNMFSAHTFFVTIPYIAISTFIFAIKTKEHMVFTMCYLLLIIWIIASHLHYTVDVLIAIYLSFTTWGCLRQWIKVPLQDEEIVLDEIENYKHVHIF